MQSISVCSEPKGSDISFSTKGGDKMKAPVFVKIEKYREVEDTIQQIKAKLEEAKGIMDRISSMKAEEEQELHNWQEDINKMEEKIEMVEHSMSR
jgi:hypothetical protein